MERKLLAVAALMGLVAVMAGTFAAHVLDGTLSPHMLDVFETGVRYHMYHALALCATAWAVTLPNGGAPAKAAGICFTLGIVLFSGSLYVLAVTGAHWLGMIAPIGGTFLLFGWILLLICALKNENPSG